MNKGQSLFEVITALFIITLIIIAIVSLSTVSIANSLFSKNKTVSARYTQEAVEWIRGQKESNPDTFFALSSGTYCLDTTSLSKFRNCTVNEKIVNIFTRELELTIAIEDGKTVATVVVTTSWQDSKGIHEANTSTVFTDRREQ